MAKLSFYEGAVTFSITARSKMTLREINNEKPSIVTLSITTFSAKMSVILLKAIYAECHGVLIKR